MASRFLWLCATSAPTQQLCHMLRTITRQRRCRTASPTFVYSTWKRWLSATVGRAASPSGGTLFVAFPCCYGIGCVRPCQGQPRYGVFLGGRCGGQRSWRQVIAEPLLRKCGVTYLNPQVARTVFMGNDMYLCFGLFVAYCRAGMCIWARRIRLANNVLCCCTLSLRIPGAAVA